LIKDLPTVTDRDSRWHDHEVATAATAWVAEPRSVDVYRRLIEAVERRNRWLQPELSAGRDQPEVFDEVGADRPPRTVGEVLAGNDPRAALDRLRRGVDG
jgi:hypothetical protein